VWFLNSFFFSNLISTKKKLNKKVQYKKIICKREWEKYQRNMEICFRAEWFDIKKAKRQSQAQKREREEKNSDLQPA
jgi:hypothetical protein